MSLLSVSTQFGEISVSNADIHFSVNQYIFWLKIKGEYLNTHYNLIAEYFNHYHQVEPFIETMLNDNGYFSDKELEVLVPRVYSQTQAVMDSLMAKCAHVDNMSFNDIVLTYAITVEPVKEKVLKATSYVNYCLNVKTAIGSEAHSGLADIVVHSIDRPGK